MKKQVNERPKAAPVSEAARILGERVRDRRHQLKLSQEAMAVQCGVHWTYLGQVERGRRNVTLHSLLKLAEGLRLDPGKLVNGLHAPNEDGD